MRQRLLMLFILTLIFSCKRKQTIAELGKQVPDYTFKKIINGSEDKIALRDLRGKTVILEFWATWCGSCIPAMSHLEKLKEEFQNDLEIITISSENEDRLLKYIEKTKTTLRIVSDKTSSSVFKFRSIPHTIVIDKKGVIRAITTPDKLTKVVLEDFIYKDSIIIEDDFNKKAEVKTLISVSNSEFQLKLTSYDPDENSSYKFLSDSMGNSIGMNVSNTGIPGLFRSILGYSYSRISYKDELGKSDFPYEDEHLYNFSIEVSDRYSNQWQNIALDHLNDFFDINGRLALDSSNCWILKNTGNSLSKSNSGDSIIQLGFGKLKLQNVTIKTLAHWLENTGLLSDQLPIIEKTGLTGHYDFDLVYKHESPETLLNNLKDYGIMVEKSDKKELIEVVEIYRKDQYTIKQ